MSESQAAPADAAQEPASSSICPSHATRMNAPGQPSLRLLAFVTYDGNPPNVEPFYAADSFEIELTLAGTAALEARMAEALAGGTHVVQRVTFMDWTGFTLTEDDITGLGNRFLG